MLTDTVTGAVQLCVLWRSNNWKSFPLCELWLPVVIFYKKDLCFVIYLFFIIIIMSISQ